MPNKIGTTSERYSLEWWKEWRTIADGILWNAQRMVESADEMIEFAEEKGWKEAEPGASFLCMLFQLKDTMEEVWSETADLEKEFPQYYDAMYDFDEDDK